MYKLVALSLFVFLSGCDCDPICMAHKEAKAFLNQEHSDSDVVDFLNSYIGEAPGAERYSVFVNWGVSKPEQFVSIMNHPNVTKKILDITAYKISDMGQSDSYCKIYAQRNETENDKYIRKSLLGCKYGL